MKEFNHPLLRQGSSGFPGGSGGKKSPCNAGSTWVQSLGQDDPLEKGTETQSTILAWRSPSLTGKPDRPQATESQRVGHCRSDCMHRCKTFFDCGSCTPVRVGHEGGAAAWLAGTRVVPSVQGHRLPPPQGLWP